ncbi:MAG: hypothetical protein R2879_00140 [Saprospiraceae bacterium]
MEATELKSTENLMLQPWTLNGDFNYNYFQRKGKSNLFGILQPINIQQRDHSKFKLPADLK